MAAISDSPHRGEDAAWDAAQLADTPLGYELRGFCRRLLGPGPAATTATRAALATPFADRFEAIARAAALCRRSDGAAVAVGSTPWGSLRAVVAAELARANATLPGRQREALALRDMLGLSYSQIGLVMGLEPPAVALLLARARLDLRAALRGAYPEEQPACVEREHVLRILARRFDSEPLGPADANWLFAHMADCGACERAHAMMLEVCTRYRAWGRS